jgi:2-polyprenyl-3-methyl-5-hydroxy-6-metoxy-1,4-benzoquinol methylase
MASIIEANIEAFYTMRSGWWENLYDGWNAQERGKDLFQPHPTIKIKALEIGPGRGAFISFLLKRGYCVDGVDLSQAICLDLRKRYGVSMTCGTLDEFQEEGPYDLIVAHHVVEHLLDLSSFFEKCRLLLTQGGQLLVSCPNAASWASAFNSWAGYEPYHSFFFNPKSMTKILLRNGFAISRIRIRQPFTGWWNVLFRSLTLSRRPCEQIRSVMNGSNTYIHFLFNVFRFVGSTLLLPLTIVTEQLSKGEELVILAEKNDSISGTSSNDFSP